MRAPKRRGSGHEIDRGDGAVLELEAPVRRLARGDAASDLRMCQRECRAIGDPGMAALLRELALEVELVRALETGIEQTRGFEALRRRGIAIEPRRLPLGFVPVEAEPLEIRLDRPAEYRTPC